MIKLKSFYGVETESLEFKEFSLREHYLDKETIIDIIEKDYYHKDLNEYIKLSIYNYIENLVPKYLSCFGNAGINGKLVIGVNDYGEITGIPFKGDLNISLKEKIISSIKKNIFFKNKKKLLNKVKYKIIQLNKDKNLLDNEDEIKEIYDNYCTKILNNNQILRDYYDEKMVWYKDLSKYSTKLFNLINTKNTRQELMDYIIRFNNNEKNKSELIELLKSNKIINVPLGINIYEKKTDKNDVIYWLTEYKDYYMEKILEKKPLKPKNLINFNIENVFTRLTPCMNRFVKQNINYYIIEIEFNMENFNDNILYRYPKTKKWINRCRTVIDGNPCCY